MLNSISTIEKHEPVSDIDTAAMDGLKALDPKRPIREADIGSALIAGVEQSKNALYLARIIA